MKGFTDVLGTAAREHIAGGHPITRIEAMVLYGIQNFPDLISLMRKEGWMIKSKRVPYAKAIRRINEFAVLQPPENLPIREIQVTEYWVSK